MQFERAEHSGHSCLALDERTPADERDRNEGRLVGLDGSCCDCSAFSPPCPRGLSSRCQAATSLVLSHRAESLTHARRTYVREGYSLLLCTARKRCYRARSEGKRAAAGDHLASIHRTQKAHKGPKRGEASGSCWPPDCYPPHAKGEQGAGARGNEQQQVTTWNEPNPRWEYVNTDFIAVERGVGTSTQFGVPLGASIAICVEAPPRSRTPTMGCGVAMRC